MQLKNKFFSGLSLAAAVMALSAFTYAQDTKPETTQTDKPAHEHGDKRGFGGKRDHGQFGRGAFGGHMGRGGFGLRGLNLTDAQKAQIKAIHEANKPDGTIMQELRTIRESRKSGTPITAEQKARIQTLREQMRTKSQSVHGQIENILTAEQKAQLERQRTEMKARREEMKGRRDGMRKRFDDRRKDRKPGDTAKPTDPKKPITE